MLSQLEVKTSEDTAASRPRLAAALKWIIGFKLFLGVLYVFVSIGVFGLLRALIHQNLDLIAGQAVDLFKLDPDNEILNTVLEKIAGVRPQTLELIGGGTALYGLLELVEAVGLWLRKHWAEWLVVMATAVFIPVEVREIASGLQHHQSVSSVLLKIGVLTINSLIVVYLIQSKDLLKRKG